MKHIKEDKFSDGGKKPHSLNCFKKKGQNIYYFKIYNLYFLPELQAFSKLANLFLFAMILPLEKERTHNIHLKTNV